MSSSTQHTHSFRFEANAPYHHIQLDSFHDYLAQKYPYHTIPKPYHDSPRTRHTHAHTLTHPFSFSFSSAIVSKLSIHAFDFAEFYSRLKCVTYRNFRCLSFSLAHLLFHHIALVYFHPFVLYMCVCVCVRSTDYMACKPYLNG